MRQLHKSFRDTPLAHRGYHDIAKGRPENSMPAFDAAVRHGYGIELDVQLSSDGVAMVFHDYDLLRLTGRRGAVRWHTSESLRTFRLRGGETGIPTLGDVLARVAGKVPVLVEIKDQDGGLGPNGGPLEQGVADAMADYRGPAAVMSFNPHSVAEFGRLMRTVPVGLTTGEFGSKGWPAVSEKTRDNLRTIPDYLGVGADFISHHVTDLSRPRVQELKEAGATILCWTVRDPEAEAEARKVAHNITFEGYAAKHPTI